VLEALLDDYYDIAHDYRPADYDADVEGQMVAVACEFGAADPVAEAIWVQRCADSGVGPSGFVAGVDLTADSVGDVLSRYRDLPVVRGVRQPLYWAADPLRRLGARPDFLSDARWLRGFERVAEQGLTWDLLVYDEQIPQAHELLRSFPQTPVVLEAVGWPLDLSAEGFKRWADRLEAVSGFANVALKLQGLALLFGPSREAIEPWVRRALAPSDRRAACSPRTCPWTGCSGVSKNSSTPCSRSSAISPATSSTVTEHGLLDALNDAEVSVVADNGYQGAGPTVEVPQRRRRVESRPSSSLTEPSGKGSPVRVQSEELLPGSSSPRR
jgi:predicted TIM-barrel fold metal-dependent hydrolase